MAKLAKALRDHAEIIKAIQPQREIDCDTRELICVLARVLEGKSLGKAFGAPGDWGYGTPIGDAIAAAPDPVPEPAVPAPGAAETGGAPRATQTMNDLWLGYRDKVYPGAMPADQYRELHQTFFAGALSAMGEFNEAAKMPEDRAAKRIGNLMFETTITLRDRAATLKQRN